MDIWRVQHDSMTCKLRFFAGDTSGVIANLLVLGLGELAVVYLYVCPFQVIRALVILTVFGPLLQGHFIKQ